MASKGRNGDSMLVHMTPGEVAGLHALAVKHGGQLTINPDTGLPEANFLKSILPMLAGLALGPAGLGLTIGGLSSAATAGLLVGGVTGLATGSLSKGLMAGLGAYGGAGIGEGLVNLGSTGFSPETLAQANKSVDPIAALSEAPKQAIPTGFEAAKAGLTTALDDPKALLNQMGGAKGALTTVGMAAAPILADQMVPTTTKAPAPMNPGMIRQKIWDGRQFVDVGPVAADQFGNKSFSDVFKGYSAKDGGIVALADGGAVRMADGGYTQDQINAALASEMAARPGTSQADLANYAKSQYGLTDAQINAAYAAQQPPAQAQTAAPVDYNKLATQYVAGAMGPDETTNQFISGANTAGIGLTQPLATALQNSGLSAGAQYALTHADIGPSSNAAETYGGLKGLSNNINYALSQYNADPTNKLKTADQKRAEARAALGKDLTEADVIRATGKTINELFPKTTTVTPTGVYGEYGNNTGNPLTSTSGDIGMNPDGTVTVTPNIPGRPQGGFTGMGQVKNAYTAGGGSLGYIPYAPKTIDEFNAKYADRMSGDSKAAYDYLTGKAGAAYPVKSTVGQISRPYDEAVLGYPARGNLPYIYDKATGKMVRNMDYIAPARDSSGNVVYGMSLNDVKKYLTDSPLSGQALYDWAKTNNLSAQQIADATGQSLSQVYAQFRAGQQAATATDKKKADEAAATAAAANVSQDGGTSGGVSASSGDSSGDSGDGGDGGTSAKRGGLQLAYAMGGMSYSGGGLGTLGGYSDGGRLLKGPGDGVSDSIPATIGAKQQPARLADGEFVVPARIVSELGNGSTDAGAKKLYAMMDRVQRARGKTTGKNKVAANTRADKYLPA
jgi:hypothetical protein